MLHFDRDETPVDEIYRDGLEDTDNSSNGS